MILSTGVATCILLAFAAADPAAAEIERLIAKYATAVAADDTGLAAEVWYNSPDVSLIHPGGHERGWEDIRRNFYEKTMFGRFTDRKLTARDVVVRVYGDAAWAEFYWHFTARLRSNGSPVETRGRETQIYRKMPGNRWALVHVHYSGLPAAQR